MNNYILFTLMVFSNLLVALPSEESLVQLGDESGLYRALKGPRIQSIEGSILGHLPCRRGAEELTLQQLIDLGRADIRGLKAVTASVRSGSWLDERLRWRIWSALQTHHAIILRGEREKEAGLSEAADDLIAGIEEAFTVYSEMQSEIKKRLELLSEKSSLLRSIVELDAQPTRLAEWAEQLEERYRLAPYNKFHRACGTTARALFSWMLDKGGEWAIPIPPNRSKRGWETLLLQVQNPAYSQALWLIESEAIDHAFILFKIDEDKFLILQSYVGYYSMSAFLASSARPYWKREEVEDFLNELRQLHDSPDWQKNFSGLHRRYFLIEPPAHILKEFIQSPHTLSYSLITSSSPLWPVSG